MYVRVRPSCRLSTITNAYMLLYRIGLELTMLDGKVGRRVATVPTCGSLGVIGDALGLTSNSRCVDLLR